MLIYILVLMLFKQILNHLRMYIYLISPFFSSTMHSFVIARAVKYSLIKKYTFLIQPYK